MQICDNLSVSAAPSQHPYPFCPFGTFPPDRGNRPLKGEVARRSRDGEVAANLHPPLSQPCGCQLPFQGSLGAPQEGKAYQNFGCTFY